MEQDTVAPETDSLLEVSSEELDAKSRITEQAEIPQVKSADLEVEEQANQSESSLQDEETQTFLKFLVSKSGTSTRNLAERFLQKIEPKTYRRVRELVTQLASENDQDTSDALRELRELGLSAKTATPWVKKLLLEDPSAEVRSRAMLTLLKISPRPSKDIIRACADSSRNIRLRLAHYFAYEWSAEDAKYTAFLRSLDDTTFSFRFNEAVSLWRDQEKARSIGLRCSSSLRDLLQLASNEGENEEKVLAYFLKDKDQEIRKLAVVALGAVPWESERVNGALTKVLFDGDMSVREWALESLESRNVSLFIALRSLANDNEADPEIRSWALSRLAKDHGNKALAFFVTLHKDQTTPPAVQTAAVGAIAKVKELQEAD